MTRRDEMSREIEARELIETLNKEKQAIGLQNAIELLDKERQALFKEDYRPTQRKTENVAKCLILSRTTVTENNYPKRCAQRYLSKVKDISEELFVLSAFASHKNTITVFGKVNKIHSSIILDWWEGTAHPPALRQYCDGFFSIPKPCVPAVSSTHDYRSPLCSPREDFDFLPDSVYTPTLPSPNSTMSLQTNARAPQLESTPEQDQCQTQSRSLNVQIPQGTVERVRKRKCPFENFETELPVQYHDANPFSGTYDDPEDRSQLCHATHDQQHLRFSVVMIEQMLEHLNSLSRRIWDVSLDESAAILRQKALDLSTQIAVHETLESTARYLLRLQEFTSPLNIQSKVTEFINVVYGNLVYDESEARWQKLRDMDCAAFLFIGLSYTPLDVTKMPQVEFDYLTANVSKFQLVKALPEKWIFHKEIQLAVAAKADLLGAARFRRKYYALEFDLEELGSEGSGENTHEKI